MMRRSSEKAIHWDTPEQPLTEAPIERAPPLDTDSPTIGQPPQPPIESVSLTYTPETLLPPVYKIASEYEHLMVDTSKLEDLLYAIDSTPAPADTILTDEIKSCFKANAGSCIITASFWEADNLTHLIPDVVFEVTEQISLFQWECAGDLVFLVGDEKPEWTAIHVREIMLNIGVCESIRLCRGPA